MLQSIAVSGNMFDLLNASLMPDKKPLVDRNRETPQGSFRHGEQHKSHCKSQKTQLRGKHHLFKVHSYARSLNSSCCTHCCRASEMMSQWAPKILQLAAGFGDMFNTTLTPCFPHDDSEFHCNSGWGTRSAGTDRRTEEEYASSDISQMPGSLSSGSPSHMPPSPVC